MIRCPNCGTDNLDGSEYCDECGSRLPVAQPPAAFAQAPAPPAQPVQPIPAAMPQGGGYGYSPGRMEASPPPPVAPMKAPPAPPPAPASSMSVNYDHPQTPPMPAAQAPAMKTEYVGTASPTSAFASGNKPGETPAAPAVRRAKLIIQRGGTVGKEFPLTETESNIGRWDADGGIFPDVDLDQDDPEAKVSRRHARIVCQEGQYLLEDLGSTNGTFVNRGRRLLPGNRHPLNDGDEVIVGKTFLKFMYIS